MLEWFKHNRVLVLSRGEELDVDNNVYFVASGVVGQYSRAESGDKLLFAFRTGEILPLMSLARSNSTGRSYIYRSMSKAELYVKKRAEFSKELENTDCLREFTSTVLDVAWNQMERIDNLQEERALPRLAQRLLYLAYRFGRHKGKLVTIEAPMSHADIAASINISRETVNRHMRLLEEQGLLSVKKRIVRIHSVDGIQKIVEDADAYKQWPLVAMPGKSKRVLGS